MVVSPESVLAAEVIGATEAQGERSGAVLWCDGRRCIDLPPGARVEVRRGEQPVLLARLRASASIGASFTDRLVAKFGLPVTGWRGRGLAAAAPAGTVLPEPAGRRLDEEPADDA
jgi:NAD+ kinase